MVAPGKVGSVGKVNFHSNSAAWIFSGNPRPRSFTMEQGSCGIDGVVRRTCVFGNKNIENESGGERVPHTRS